MEFLNPEKVLKGLNLKGFEMAADFGSGSGGWTIPLAKILNQGKVFAIEILEEPISALFLKLKTENIKNVEIRMADVEERVPILPESLDLVLMTNLLFECQKIKKVLEEGKKILKGGGKILIVDWKEKAKIGPERKVKKEEIKKLAKAVGLKLKEEFEAGDFHFGILFEKPRWRNWQTREA